MPVFLGCGDAGWLGGLFWFVCVRAGSFCATVPHFLCLWILASGFWWVEFLDKLRCLLWWFVSWVVLCWLVSGVLWADRFWFEAESKFVTHVLLSCCDVSSDRRNLSYGRSWTFEAYHHRVPYWSLLAVLVLWRAAVRGFSNLRVLVVFGGFFGVFIFSFWCNPWDLIPLYIYIYNILPLKKIKKIDK